MKYLFIIISLISAYNSFGKTLPAHEHGSVKLDLAVDKDTLLVMLNSPSESFLGFEYKAKSKKEKALVQQVKNEWNKNLTNLIGTTALKSCKINETNWKQHFTSSSHSNIIAESYLKCSKPLAGKMITINLTKYKRIKNLHLQLIRDDGSAVSKKYSKTKFKLKL